MASKDAGWISVLALCSLLVAVFRQVEGVSAQTQRATYIHSAEVRSLMIELLHGGYSSPTPSNTSNTYTTYNDYDPSANNYSLDGLYCATYDSDQSPQWRSQYYWAAFCGQAGGPMGPSLCGKCLSVVNPSTQQSVRVRILDQCSNGGLDLETAAFGAIDDMSGAGYNAGHLYTTYTFAEGLLKCSACSRSVHVNCQHMAAVTLPMAAPMSEPFLCPHCQNPNSDVMPFALLNSHRQGPPNKKLKGAHGRPVNSQSDFVSAKVVLTAARIASASMHSVAATASAEAQKRAMEAARLRKEAKEAIHRALNVAMEEESKAHTTNPSTATPTSFTANADKMNSEIVSQNLATGSLTSMPMTKATIAGEPNGPAR